MDLKKLFEIAGVNTKAGKAKTLLETLSVPPAGVDIGSFLRQNPNIQATVNMGTYDIGEQDSANVAGAKQFFAFVSAFCSQHVDGNPAQLFVVPAQEPNTFSLMFKTDPDQEYDEYEEERNPNEYGFDPDADEVGHFVLLTQ